MKNLIATLFLFVTLAAGAQPVVTANTNFLVITGAGATNISFNGTYQFDASGTWFYMTNGVTTAPDSLYNWPHESGGVLWYGDYNWYKTTSFPTTWALATVAPLWPGNRGSVPSGSYLQVTNWLSVTNWSTGLTNFWATPGDLVTFSAAGKNLAATGVSSNYLTVMLDTNVVLVSPWAAGNRLPWSVAGSLQWDGTNMSCIAHMATGDTNSPIADAFNSFPINIGTNTFTLFVSGFTNSLTVDSANITAVRAPIGDVVSHIYPPASSGGGSSVSGLTNVVVTTTNLLIGGGYVTSGVTNGIAYFYVAFPPGGTNTFNFTNTITSYNFTNQVLQSKQITVLATNFAFWSGSNYLGRVAGIIDWNVSGGDDGGANPSTAPAAVPVTLYGTFATNNTGWFLLTNNFFTPSNISLAVLSASASSFGTPRINPGFANIFSLDRWELKDRTNFMDYQNIGSHVAPTYGWQFANKDYIDGKFFSAFNNNFSSSIDSNFVTHFVYSVMGHAIVDFRSHTRSVPAIDMVPGGRAINPDTRLAYPTNLFMTVYATNLSSSYALYTQTNPVFGTFYPYTNFIASTSGGITTLTIQNSGDKGFFYVVNGFDFGVTFNDLVTATNGIVSLLATTNSIGLADTNKTGHILYLYASTNGGSAALYIHGSDTQKMMTSHDYKIILILQSVCTVILVVFAIAHTRWHVRRRLGK